MTYTKKELEAGAYKTAAKIHNLINKKLGGADNMCILSYFIKLTQHPLNVFLENVEKSLKDIPTKDCPIGMLDFVGQAYRLGRHLQDFDRHLSRYIIAREEFINNSIKEKNHD